MNHEMRQRRHDQGLTSTDVGSKMDSSLSQKSQSLSQGIIEAIASAWSVEAQVRNQGDVSSFWSCSVPLSSLWVSMVLSRDGRIEIKLTPSRTKCQPFTMPLLLSWRAPIAFHVLPLIKTILTTTSIVSWGWNTFSIIATLALATNFWRWMEPHNLLSQPTAL